MNPSNPHPITSGRPRAAKPPAEPNLFRLAALFLPLVCLAPFFAAGAPEPRSGTGTRQSSHLYTAPDPAAGGGIHGRVSQLEKPIVSAFAQASDDWKRVYRGDLSSDRMEFTFSGLPVGVYDLFILYADSFYEGLSLTRDENTLTDKDKASIKAAIMKSTAFFNEKEIHRCEGNTGYAGKARCVLQEVRTRPVTLQSAETRSNIQIRSIKLILPEDVGPGWSVINSREIVRQEVAATDVRGFLTHHFVPELGHIRVIDKIKELGNLSLQ